MKKENYSSPNVDIIQVDCSEICVTSNVIRSYRNEELDELLDGDEIW